MNKIRSINTDTLMLQALLLIVAVLYAALVALKSPQVWTGYLLSVAPVLAAGAALVFFASHSSDRVASFTAFAFAFLMISGTAFQSLIGYHSTAKMVVITLVSIVLAVGALVAYNCILKNRVLISKQAYLYVIYSVAAMSAWLYIVLLVFGVSINGARLWISFGGFTLQLTEIAKLLFFINITLIFNCEQSTRRKMLYGLMCLMMHVMFLVVLNEFATAVLLGLTYVISAFIFTKTRYAVVMLISFAAVFSIAIFLLFSLHDTLKDNMGFFAENFCKVYDRLVCADKDQQTRALQSLYNGSMFGCKESYVVYLFSEEADFAIANFAQHFGLFMMLMCVGISALFCYMVYRGSLNSSINNSREYKLALIFTIGIAVQMIINLGSNLSVLPCFGVGYPFISFGGTQMMILYLMVLFIVDGVRSVDRNKEELNLRLPIRRKTEVKFYEDLS